MSDTETPTVDSDPGLDLLAEALAKFQADMPTVSKSHTAKVRTNDGGQYSYTYADLADVTEAAMPLLAKHGLSFVTLPGPTGLVGLLLHSSGQRLRAVLPITGATPQQVGSSLTYMRRYLLGCMTGIVTDDDDDGQAAQTAKPQPRKRSEPRPPVAPPIATEEHPAPDGSVDVPLPNTEPQRMGSAHPRMVTAMHTGLREVMPSNIERDDRLAIVAAMVRRSITTTKELTDREVSIVLGNVERIKAGVAGIEHVDGEWQLLSYALPPNEGDPS